MEDLIDVDSEDVEDELAETRTPTQIKIELLITNNLGYPENRCPFYSHTRNIPEVIRYRNFIRAFGLSEARQEWRELGRNSLLSRDGLIINP